MIVWASAALPSWEQAMSAITKVLWSVVTSLEAQTACGPGLNLPCRQGTAIECSSDTSPE